MEEKEGVEFEKEISVFEKLILGEREQSGTRNKCQLKVFSKKKGKVILLKGVIFSK